jgi:ferricrocin synthase
MAAAWRAHKSVRTSAAIIVAFAKTLGHFTNRSRPTFGLNHASRSLSSVDGTRTLDLTAASLPTLTMTPFCMELDGGFRRSGSPPLSARDDDLLDFVQDHLAQLTKFAQADGLQGMCPRFNSYLNILYMDDDAAEMEEGGSNAAERLVLRRHRLGEPLASDYFTVARPSSSTVSTIDGLETAHLCPRQLFFNVVVGERQGISVGVSGDDALCSGDMAMVSRLVSYFVSELTKILNRRELEG